MGEGEPIKICVLCGEDCSQKPRTKDRKGRYYCRECYDEALERQEARRYAPEAPPPAADPGAEPGFGVDPDNALDLGLDEPDATPVTMAMVCPGCRAPLAREAVVCVSCGYNMQTASQLKVKTKKPKRDSSAAPEALGMLLSPLAVTIAALGFFGILFAVALGNEGAAMGYLALQGLFALAFGVTVLVFAFMEGIGQGLLTLCVPFYIIYYVYGVCENQWIKWLFLVYLLSTVGTVVIQLQTMQSQMGGMGGGF